MCVVLGTYTNTENHPAVLDAPQKRKKMQIKVNAQGVPMGVLTGRPSKQQQQKQKEEEEIERRNNGEARQKNETKEERRERKKALKEERRSNRQRKKDLKVAYKSAQLGAHAELIKPQQRTSVMHY
jgi:protein LTV1